MTRKEAALMLDPETRQCFRVPHRTKDTLQAAFDEACFMGAAALREQEERENPKLLTLDELREMGGKPYWHVGLREGSQPPHWNILDPFYAKHIDDYGYGKRWLAYRNEPKKK